MPANAGEQAGSLILFDKVKSAWWSGKLTLIWADEGFAGVEFEAQVKHEFGWTLEIGAKEPGQKGFSVQRKRWLIEQVFGCWERHRRLSRDWESSVSSLDKSLNSVRNLQSSMLQGMGGFK